MKKLWLVSFVLLFIVFVTLAGYGQDLQTTLSWMKTTLAAKGFSYQQRNGWSSYSVVQGTRYTELIAGFSYTGCHVKVTKLAELIDYAGDNKYEYTDTFNLIDMDTNSVRTDIGDGNLNGTVVVFSTTNDRKLIHCTSVVKTPGPKYNKPDECVPAEDDSEQLRFSTAEYTQRFAKALRHAINLCGGKPSAF